MMGEYNDPLLEAEFKSDKKKNSKENDNRGEDTVSELSRLMNTVCMEAASEHEIVAHLESLGYNQHRIKKEFGYDDIFGLARDLFTKTPKKVREKLKVVDNERPLWTRQLVLLMAIVVTMFAFVDGSWSMVLWIISWSFMGNFLIARSPSERPPSEHLDIVSAALYMGLIGIGIIFAIFPIGYTELSLGIFWWGVASWTWHQRFENHYLDSAYGLIPIGALLFASVFRASPSITFLILCVTAIFMVYDLPKFPIAKVWKWISQNFWAMLPVTGYGLGQGLLLMALLQQGSLQWNALGIGIIVIMLMSAERLVLWLKSMLKELLWADDVRSRRIFVTQTLYICFKYLLPFLLVFVGIFALTLNNWSIYQLIPLINFGLFGLSLAFALGLSSLNETDPVYKSFFAMGLLSLTALPLLYVLLILNFILCIRFLIHTRRVENYGIYLL